jgi:SAM-dependent methyltransferase
MLARSSFSSLRGNIYRYGNWASATAEHCVRAEATRVLIPSVGICVHPWLFAERGLSVIATDNAPTALATVESPERLPMLYGRAAKRRWDIDTVALYGGLHFESFVTMPEIERPEVADPLRQRIEFVRADWASLPLPDGSVDVVFATNALPRGDDELRVRVLEEWVRVIRPGGLLFCAQHNDRISHLPVIEFLQRRGFFGQPGPPGARMFQLYYSSG